MDKIRPLSTEAREFAALESRLETGDLSLSEIRGIEDQMLLKPTHEKMKKLGEQIFTRIGQKRKALVEREINQLAGQSDLNSKVRRLNLLNPDLSPEEVDIQTLSLFREVPLEEDVRAQETALKQLEDIRFMTAQPIVQELDDEALSSNFASRMRQIAKTMVEQNSFIPFKEGLTPRQQKEVYRYAGGAS